MIRDTCERALFSSWQLGSSAGARNELDLTLGKGWGGGLLDNPCQWPFSWPDDWNGLGIVTPRFKVFSEACPSPVPAECSCTSPGQNRASRRIMRHLPPRSVRHASLLIQIYPRCFTSQISVLRFMLGISFLSSRSVRERDKTTFYYGYMTHFRSSIHSHVF